MPAAAMEATNHTQLPVIPNGSLRSSVSIPSISDHSAASSHTSLSNLIPVNTACTETKVPNKSKFKCLRENVSLSIKWAKIAINNLLPFQLFNLQQTRATNPINLYNLDKCSSASKALDLTLDYLKAVKTHDEKRIPALQKELVDEICYGEASDFLLDLFNFVAQESLNSQNQITFLTQLPPQHQHILQELFNTLKGSSYFARIQEFSLYLNKTEQRQLLQKINEFPFRQFRLGEHFTKIALKKLNKFPEVSNVLTPLIDNKACVPGKSGVQTKSTLESPDNIIPNIKKILEVSAEALDVYKRASQEPNPSKAIALRNNAISSLHNAINQNPDFLPSFHYLVDATIQRGREIKSGVSKTDSADNRLLELLQKFAPGFSGSEIQKDIDDFCRQYSAPLELFQTMTNRLSLEDEKTALFSLLHTQSSLSQSMMHLLFTGLKTVSMGRIPENQYHEPKPLEEKLDLKKSCLFIEDLIQNSDSPAKIKSVLQKPAYIPFIRNILMQKDSKQALNDFKALLPEAFHDNVQSYFDQYHLQSLSTIGRHIVPHLSDQELSKIIGRLPEQTYGLIQTKLDNFVKYLGDPDKNLITALDHQRHVTQGELTTLLDKVRFQCPELFSPEEKDFKKLLHNAKVHVDDMGTIPQHRLTTLLYEHKKLLQTTSAQARFSQLNTLLAAMQIPQDLSKKYNFIDNPMDAAEYRYNLSALRSGLSQYRIHEELHNVAQQLFPAANDPQAANDDPAINNAANDSTPTNSFTQEDRKDILSEFMKAISQGIEPNPPQNQTVQLKQNKDMLWKLTYDLVNSTERTHKVVSINDKQILNRMGKPSQLIFMENGTCVDEEGIMLPRGDQKNLALQQQFHIPQKIDEKRQACRDNLKQVIQQNLPNLIKLLSEHPTNESFQQLLDKALLPKDVQNLLINLLNQIIPSNFRQSEIGQYATRGMQHMKPDTINKVINRMPDALFDRFADQVTRLIDDLSPYEQMPFFKEFADKLVISLGDNKSVQTVAGLLTKGYFPAIPLADKRKIAEAILKLGCPETDSNGKVTSKSMEALIDKMTQAGGPGFQKAMQLFKGDIKIASIREALDNMNSEVDPMPAEKVKRIIENDELFRENKVTGEPPKYKLLDKNNYTPKTGWPSKEEVENLHLKKLGSATIAQSHAAFIIPYTVDKDGHEIKDLKPIKVAIKVQRDLVAHDILREMQALQRIPNIPESAAKTLKELERSIVAETNTDREFQFGKLMGELYTDAKGEVNVVGMLDKSDRLLIQGFAEGESIEKLWHKKSSSFQLYFGDIPATKAASSKNEPYKIQLKLDGETPSLNIITPDSAIKTHPLRKGSALVTKLERYFQEYGTIKPDFAATQHIISEIKKDITLPPIKDAVNLTQQATFLEIAGNRLKTLIADFANAAFNGIRDKAFSLETNEVLMNTPETRKRKVFIQRQTDDSTQQKHWSFKVFDAKGAEVKSWTSNKALTEHEKTLLTQLNSLLGNVEPPQTDNPPSDNTPNDRSWQVQLNSLSTQQIGKLNNTLRELLSESMLFEGESFIDSDRHDGNLHYNENSNKLTCIDTGAGTIVTKFEREGMWQLAQGILQNNSTILYEGLQQLIPELKDKPQDDINTLKQDLKKSLNKGDINTEKTDEIFQYLLKESIIEVDEDIPSGVHNPAGEYFYNLLNGNTILKDKVLSFDQTKKSDQAVDAIMKYVNIKRSIAKLPPKTLDKQSAIDFSKHLEKLSYARMFKVQLDWPTNLITDGHNSLLFIKTIRKIANVLEKHNVYAPESIIQLNRGTKFIEDQLKNINFYKIDLQDKMEDMDKYNISNPEYQPVLTASVKHKLIPVNLGGAYMEGLLSNKWNVLNDFANISLPAFYRFLRQYF